MRRPLVLIALLPMALLSSASPASGVEAIVAPRADGAVQVTADPAGVRGHATPSVAVHPDDDRLIAIAEGDAYTSRCQVHVSTDAGLTWAAAATPEIPTEWQGCMFATTGTIADLAFGDDGTLYHAVTGFNPSTYQQRTFLARSDDLGESWETVELPWIAPDSATGQSGADGLPQVVVDPDDPERVSVGWWSNNGTWNLPESLSGGKEWCDDLVPRPWVTTSDDGGRTFSEAVDLAPGVQGCMTEPYLLAGNDGELFAFFGESSAGEEGKAEPARLFQSVSRDGGKTFTATAIHTQAAPNEGTAADADSDWLSAPSPGIDRSSGDLYVVWEEMGEGVPSIQFMRSGDGAASWGEPVKLNDVDPMRDWDFTEEFPSLSVAPDGRIDVAWYDFRNDTAFVDGEEAENGFQDVYLTSSANGGSTWTADLRVNDRAIDRRFGARSTGYITGPVGLASTDEVAYVAWDDTRNGNAENGTQDIYATRVRFSPPEEVFATQEPASRLSPLSVLLGASGMLVLGGLALAVVTRTTRTARTESG
jgi:hypothetical protein